MLAANTYATLRLVDGLGPVAKTVGQTEMSTRRANRRTHKHLAVHTHSVPARLGKGQGAKEIGHNLAREQPKSGHNLVRKRHKIGHSLECDR